MARPAGQSQVPPLLCSDQAKAKLQHIADMEGITLSTAAAIAMALFLEQYGENGLPNDRASRMHRTALVKAFRKEPSTA
jgi:hypothetical protein